MKLYSYNIENKQYILEEKSVSDIIKNAIANIDYGYSFTIYFYKNKKELGIDISSSVMSETMSDTDIEKTVSDIVKYIKYIKSITQKCEIETLFNLPDPSWGSSELKVTKTEIDEMTQKEYEEYRNEGFDILITDLN